MALATAKMTGVSLPAEVVTSVDPIIDLPGVAQVLRVPLERAAQLRGSDPAFPASLGELACGPVFAYGAILDYAAGHGGDASLRQARPDGTTDPLRMMQLTRADAAPRIGTRSNPAYVMPVWQPREETDPLRGGRWVAAVFADDLDEDAGEEDETYEVLAEVRLHDLMARADWTMWLTLHVRAMRAATEEAGELLQHVKTTPPGPQTSERAMTGASTLMEMCGALAEATVEKGDQHDCPLPHIAEAFSLAHVFMRELAVIGQAAPA